MSELHTQELSNDARSIASGNGASGSPATRRWLSLDSWAVLLALAAAALVKLHILNTVKW